MAGQTDTRTVIVAPAISMAGEMVPPRLVQKHASLLLDTDIAGHLCHLHQRVRLDHPPLVSGRLPVSPRIRWPC
jgi:hypothetical protein